MRAAHAGNAVATAWNALSRLEGQSLTSWCGPTTSVRRGANLLWIYFLYTMIAARPAWQ